MSMSTHIVGFKPPDDNWKKMKAIWDACEAGGVNIPEEVLSFFDGEKPDEMGVEIDLEGDPCIREIEKESQQGYEVDITRLPKAVKFVRFFNSY
jgi:hypothetical protein